ncbi:MAG TPA: HesA/MoeB/ThiF family protein [Reyranella sp.]|nr:HesA/MoeB/ThiF family protein [Reyranella sp.]
MFSDREVERYARHLVLREIGGPGQQNLKASSVLFIGAGGIGAPASLYLAAAGVGRIGLIDDDSVALSNLQRQVIYAETDLGRPKTEAARERLQGLNCDIRVDTFAVRLNRTNARTLVRGWNLVIDGSDTFETRLVVSDACVAEEVALISAAIGRWRAMIGLFRGRPCYRCLVAEAPPDPETCVAVGVVGALAGAAGSMAALLAVRTIVQAGADLAGEVTSLDALDWRMHSARVVADPACPACGDRASETNAVRSASG